MKIARVGKWIGLALVLSFWLGMGGVGIMAQRTLTVCPSGCQFTKIQDAINAAQEGDIIEVGPGVYREDLEIGKSKLTLRGSASDQVRLRATSPDRNAIDIASGTMGIRIERLTISGGFNGVAVRGRDHILQSNIFTDNQRGIQVFTMPDYRVEILNNTFGENGQDIVMLMGQAGIRNNRLKLIDVGDLSRAEIQGNIIEMGILINGQAIIQNNRVLGTIKVIPQGEHPPTQILNNHIQGEGEEGPRLGIEIRAYGRLSPFEVLIQGNTIVGHEFYGIGLITGDAAQVQIRENIISNNGEGGIIILAGAWVQMEQNTIERHTQGWGILLQGPSTRISLRSNLIRLNAIGVAIETGRVELRDNQILDHFGWGVTLFVKRCFPWATMLPERFEGEVTGGGNEIRNNGRELPPEIKQAGDGEGNVCPKELLSLKK